MKSEIKSTEQKVAFFDKPENITWMMRIFYTICIVLVAADFIVHRHIYVSFEEIPTFYALYGFVACVVLVVIAKGMRKFVMRDENYYDKRDDEVELDVPRVSVEHHEHDAEHSEANSTKESH
jgi:hypothetical protein